MIMKNLLLKITNWISSWELDKVLHFTAGYILMSIFLAFSPITDFKWATIGTFFITIIALGKEIIDMLRDGKKSGFDFLDVLWTLVGSTICALLMNLLPLIGQFE